MALELSSTEPVEESTSRLRNRTRTEILVSILNVASGGALKTHIMYKSNLSHRQLKRYLVFLESNGLLQVVSDPADEKLQYEITEKGINFLRDYSRLSNYFSEKSI